MVSAVVAAGLVAVGVAFVSLAVLHVVGRGLSPVERTISEYVLLGPVCRAGFRVMVVGLAVAGLAVLVLERGHPVAVVSLALFGVGLLAAGVVPTDPVDLASGEVELSRAGRVHLLAASVAFLSPVVAAFAVGPAGAFPAQYLPLTGLCCFIVSLALGPALPSSFRVRAVHGIGERLWMLATMAWLAIALAAHT